MERFFHEAELREYVRELKINWRACVAHGRVKNPKEATATLRRLRQLDRAMRKLGDIVDFTDFDLAEAESKVPKVTSEMKVGLGWKK